MKKSLLFILFILLNAMAFSQKGAPSWKVSNTSIVSGCPYEVCFYMELRDAMNNPIPGSNVQVCHTIPTGSSATYSYPMSVLPSITIVVTGIQVNIGSSSYAVPVNSNTTIYDACSALDSPECLTYWGYQGQNNYWIQGNCLVGR